MTPRILAFSGSIRRDSLNQKLVEIASNEVRKAGGEVTVIHLRDYQLPLFNQDLEDEEGLPTNLIKLKDLFRSHHGLLIASPEYNSSVTSVLKNTIDWLSRVGRPILPGPLLLLSTSPGGRGGQTNLGVLAERAGRWGATVTGTFSLPSFHKTFDRQARTLVDPEDQARLDAAIATFEAALPS